MHKGYGPFTPDQHHLSKGTTFEKGFDMTGLWISPSASSAWSDLVLAAEDPALERNYGAGSRAILMLGTGRGSFGLAFFNVMTYHMSLSVFLRTWS